MTHANPRKIASKLLVLGLIVAPAVAARLPASTRVGSEAPTASRAAEPTAASKPNVVYIVADDLGWKDVGYHGSDVKTPTIDRLAATGARLEQFYAQPMCTPTRACLMTGRYPLRYGLQTAVILSARLPPGQRSPFSCPSSAR